MTFQFQKIDAHTHLFYDRAFLLPLLERWKMKAVVVNITGKGFFPQSMEQRWADMVALREAYPDHFALCTTFDPEGVTEPGFADRVVRQLEAQIREGAALVKVWKDVGLGVRDRDGRYVQIDDARFQPIWDFLADAGLPVLAHIAEPRSAWLPLDRRSPHYRFYAAHPEHHLYTQPEAPSWEHLIRARDAWVERNPKLTVIGAHLGSMEHDVDEVARRLDRYPNFYVDTAERFADLMTQPSEKVRRFFVRYSDRILYGTDVIVDRPAAEVPDEQQEAERTGYEDLLAGHLRYLSGRDVLEIQDKFVDPVRVQGLDLPPEVLEQVYAGNAARLLRL